MRYAHHGGTTLYTNLVTDVRVAKTLGYDSIELWTPKVLRYLRAGYSIDDLVTELDGLPVPMLDVVIGIERTDSQSVADRIRETEQLAAVAVGIGCPTLEVVALDDFEDDSWASQRRVLIDSLRAMSDVTAPLGIKLAVEPVTFSRFNHIAPALEVIDAVGSDRVGLCLDTWHLWTSGEKWDEIAQIDPALILSAQLADTNPKVGPTWKDSDRTALPGDGIVPLEDAVAAIEATGYRGHWCNEMLSSPHWEWDPYDHSRILLERLKHYVGP